MKHIVILGGGFGGIAAALELRKHTETLGFNITIINDQPYHALQNSLYEVATSEEPQKNIAIPLKEIFEKEVTVIIEKVTYIQPALHRVYLENDHHISYDYLILALGSEPAYFNIPGLAHHSTPLKYLSDAIRIRDDMREKYHEKIKNNETLKIVVGGGGFSGTELTAELIDYRHRLAEHHHKSPDSIDITIIQGSECLLKELDKEVSNIAARRISEEGVNIIFGSHITQVTQSMIITDSGKKLPYDLFIWTGGIKANNITHTSGLPTNRRGQVIVNQYLQVEGHEDIYAVGDIAEYTNPLTKKPVPNVAPAAEAQGKAAAYNIYRKVKELPQLTFHYVHAGYIVPLRGRYGVAQLGRFHITGLPAWLIQQAVLFYYLFSILSLHKAFMKWNKIESELDC